MINAYWIHEMTSNETNIVDEILHCENKNGDTLLKIVMSQGDSLPILPLALINLEKQFHRKECKYNNLFVYIITCLFTCVL